MSEKLCDLEELLKDYPSISPDDQPQLIRLLKEIQERCGCVPQEAQERISNAYGLKGALITALIRRIPSLREEETPCRVTVCLGPRCSPKGSPAVLKRFEQELGIKSGEKNRLYSLKTCNCRKKCATSPNVWINDVHYPGVTPQEVPEILRKFLEKP